MTISILVPTLLELVKFGSARLPPIFARQSKGIMLNSQMGFADARKGQLVVVEKRIPPMSNPSFIGDLPAPWDSWLGGDLTYEDLPPRDQRLARLMLNDAESPVQRLNGLESEVRFFPGDQFTGVEQDWLIGRLALEPGEDKVHFSEYEDAPLMSIFLDGKEIHLLDDGDGVPLGPGVDFWQNPVATIGEPDSLESELFALTLYRGGPWLVSVWPEVHEDYLPMQENEMGEEISEDEVSQYVWKWIVEMVIEWSATGVQQDLPINSELIDATDSYFMRYVREAAEGGRGVVTVNGREALGFQSPY